MTRKQKKLLWRILAAVVLLVAAVVLSHTWLRDAALWRQLLIFLPAYLVAGYDVLRRALLNILHGQLFDENFLMALATLGALAVGFLPTGEAELAEAVFVMIFYQVGQLFESIAVGKSRRSISALMAIRPDTVRVLREGEEVILDPSEVAVGELILIRAGERVALDGVVLEGSSELDTAALTGESLPRAVTVGESVYSGSTNLSGALTVRVDKPFESSTVARILSLIENAAARKSRSEQFITRFARYYTPLVVLSALLLAVLPPLFSGDFAVFFPVWLVRALSFLVISCPCALVISVPLSFFGGIGGASRLGVLIKGSRDLEALARVKTVVLDKTGTLTEGRLAVSLVRTARPDIAEDTVLRLAAAAEQTSNHPIARALRAAAGEGLPASSHCQELAGYGVVVELDGKSLAVGNDRLMQKRGIASERLAALDGASVFVARDGVLLGGIGFSDTVKANAKESIDALRAMGASRIVMLTGDGEPAAAAVARTVGITEWHSDLLPADKVAEVERLQNGMQKGTLAFVGDGINDAPVLSRADVGVAMGALGSDAAIEAADVVLMDDDLTKLAGAIGHARKTIGIVRQNISFALTAKAAVLLCSAVGLLGSLQMVFAVFADVGVAAIAILNAMRALRGAVK